MTFKTLFDGCNMKVSFCMVSWPLSSRCSSWVTKVSNLRTITLIADTNECDTNPYS
jgi:hypothetical protein